MLELSKHDWRNLIVFNSLSKETRAINPISDNFYKYCPLSCTLLNGKSLLSNEFGEKFHQPRYSNAAASHTVTTQELRNYIIVIS